MKNIFLTLMISILLINLIGCGPSGDPAEIGWKFYDNIMFDNYKEAYALITKEDQQKVSFEKFKDLFTNFKNLLTINGLDAESLGEEEDKNIYKKYDKAEMIMVKIDFISFIDIPSFDGESVFTVVDDEGEWKVLFSSMFDFDSYYSNVLLYNSMLYASGSVSSIPKDLDKAIKYCDKALEADPYNYQVYSQYMMLYLDKNEYDKALEYGRKHYDLLKEKQENQESKKYPNGNIVDECIIQRSNIATMMAFILSKKGNKKAARQYIQHALELNSNNAKAHELYEMLF